MQSIFWFGYYYVNVCNFIIIIIIIIMITIIIIIFLFVCHIMSYIFVILWDFIAYYFVPQRIILFYSDLKHAHTRTCAVSHTHTTNTHTQTDTHTRTYIYEKKNLYIYIIYTYKERIFFNTIVEILFLKLVSR